MRKALSHQKQTGMTSRYQRRRLPMMHRHEVVLGDMRLYNWVLCFKPFLQWGKPCDHVVSIPRTDGRRVYAVSGQSKTPALAG